jgi:hypothetical protein
MPTDIRIAVQQTRQNTLLDRTYAVVTKLDFWFVMIFSVIGMIAALGLSLLLQGAVTLAPASVS